MSDAIILHHYDTSPFSEKVRVLFGFKGMAWTSVHVPNMMPKPDFTPLSGGYRRTPALQIGADVYCDTQVMMAEIERRCPTPSMVPDDAAGLVWPINWWADRLFFQTTVPIIFGALGDKTPEAFIKDREQLSGRPFDVAAMKGAIGPMKQQWRSQMGWLEAQLAASKSGWLVGKRPSLADASAYMNVWFLARNLPDVVAELTTDMPHIAAWQAMVEAFGHGRPTEMDGPTALAIAKAATPLGTEIHDEADPLGVKVGEAVTVMADDYGRDQVKGTLVAANRERIVISRDDPAVGPVHVHFPRTGYFAFPG
ncbi:MAG: glutathione S-transferase family protein [Caulobacteraceae bacterium]|nr:glutathione S-transferase family protein [Caulobacteraceae bacterium]